RAAVGTERLDHADGAVAIAKSDKVLAEESQTDRIAVGLVQLLGQGERQPEMSEQLAHGLTASDAGHEDVALSAQHCFASGRYSVSRCGTPAQLGARCSAACWPLAR